MERMQGNKGQTKQENDKSLPVCPSQGCVYLSKNMNFQKSIHRGTPRLTLIVT